MITDREIQIARLKAGLEREWGAREETPEETARYDAKLGIPHPRPLLRIPLWHNGIDVLQANLPTIPAKFTGARLVCGLASRTAGPNGTNQAMSGIPDR